MSHWRGVACGGILVQDGNMDVTVFRQNVVTTPPVRADLASRFDRRLNGLRERFSCGVLQHGKANAANSKLAVFCFFRRDENQGLAFGYAPAFPWTLTAKESLVHFNNAGQPVAAGTDHGAAQLVQPFPCCVIAAGAQRLLQPQRADAILLVYHIPHRLEP